MSALQRSPQPMKERPRPPAHGDTKQFGLYHVRAELSKNGRWHGTLYTLEDDHGTALRRTTSWDQLCHDLGWWPWDDVGGRAYARYRKAYELASASSWRGLAVASASITGGFDGYNAARGEHVVHMRFGDGGAVMFDGDGLLVWTTIDDLQEEAEQNREKKSASRQRMDMDHGNGAIPGNRARGSRVDDARGDLDPQEAHRGQEGRSENEAVGEDRDPSVARPQREARGERSAVQAGTRLAERSQAGHGGVDPPSGRRPEQRPEGPAVSWDAFMPPDLDDELPDGDSPMLGEPQNENAPRGDREHRCHARRCDAHCQPEHLMCAKHWRMVPKKLQEAVWATYRPGQCDDMRPSQAWHEAASAAIAAVYEKEFARWARLERLAAGLPAKDEPDEPDRVPPPQTELALGPEPAEDAPAEPSESFMETGYATPPSKKPSKKELQNAWMGEAVRRHDKERKRIYCEAMALVLSKLAERWESSSARSEIAWIASWVLELGIVKSDPMFTRELRQLRVDPSMFLEDPSPQ